ncbi:NAD(P)-binding Rossmann-fold containing protein [Venustampulla echinocandica]|uniref:NAD(P)-binding Rossmann-fold containing protein n=1 Tax=Venustampulla echinocandica TaxID=2656787 RepID=A0A370TFT4_9HELO|nr:NAD(P)-binding Rossmann-fold containing protein [Venustampulla echinocandica]RDL33753.1 NAD(P)-binding Rossmann-fold containing protein [Venustampulla echinocandica]
MAPALPQGSVVLVTGATSYLGSNIVDQLLKAGYNVRGTVRSMTKLRNLKNSWDEEHGMGKFEPIIVLDMAKEGAFDEAVKGVDGVIHSAAVMTFDADPHKVIPETLAGVNEILKSAAKEPRIKRFVFTSSSTAATAPIPNKEFHIDSDSWNDAEIKAAWAPPPYEPQRAWAVYGASKAESEKAVWKFVKEQKPHFVVNAVLPDFNFGKILDKSLAVSTADFVRRLFKGNKETVLPQYFVDVQDTGLVHVAALINPEVANERILAMAEPFNCNDILRIFRKLRPDHKFIDDYQDDSVRDRSTVSNERAVKLLKYMGKDGWTSLEESIKVTIEAM